MKDITRKNGSAENNMDLRNFYIETKNPKQGLLKKLFQLCYLFFLLF